MAHFKELFALDGKHANLTLNDVQRRNRIAQLIADWGLVEIVDVSKIQDIALSIRLRFLHTKISRTGFLKPSIISGQRKRR